jgi:DNA-binding LacI/PurR family transcriptional regulator
MEPIGINEVAALAGVSPATVSRALRGLPGVAAGTRSAVTAAAELLGYVASPSATSLSTGKSGAIGILAPWLSRWFFAAAIEGVQEVLFRHNYDALLYPAGSGIIAGAGKLDVRGLHKRVDGVVALNMPHGIDALPKFRIPVVTVGGVYSGMASVTVDDVKVGRMATEHLIGLGHRAIAFLGEDSDRIYGFTSATDRRQGYDEALAAAGIPVNGQLVEVTGFSIRGAEAGLHRLWKKALDAEIPIPTAVFAVSDEAAMGILRAAADLGLEVPHDLSVIGVDNHDMAYLFELTTIAQPVRDEGRLAAELLLKQIAQPDATPEHLVVEPELIVRRSTAPIRDQAAGRVILPAPVARN